jgi:hypothetical protein
MRRRRWQEWRSPGDPAITFRLLPPTPDKPGRLVIEEGALSTVIVLTWEPPLVAVHLAGACPCCGAQLVARGFADGRVRVRTLRLENALQPTDVDGATFGEPPTEAEWRDLSEEYHRERLDEADGPPGGGCEGDEDTPAPAA